MSRNLFNQNASIFTNIPMHQSHRPPTKRKEVYRLNAFEALFSAAWSNKVSMHIRLYQNIIYKLFLVFK